MVYVREKVRPVMQRVWGSSEAKTTGPPVADKTLRCPKTCQKAEDTGSGEEKLGVSLGVSERARCSGSGEGSSNTDFEGL